jgi:acetolactate synthase-1/2/3 large subunit
MGQRQGGHILVQHMQAERVERVFSVPGESFLPILDALHDSPIRNIVCRHEGGAAMMAEATGKLTGRPGVALVTRGPGATNAAAGVHVARQDSSPMILLVGQVARAHRDREAFQEIDIAATFAPLAKWAAEVQDTARLPEYMSRAFHVAQSGRPGPVVLGLPEDVLSGMADPHPIAPVAPPVPGVSTEQINAALHVLTAAQRPLVVVGGSHWSVQATQDLAAFASAFDLPVAASFRRMDRIDNNHPCYAGDLGVGMNPALAARLRDADAVLVLGARLGDIASGGYRLAGPDQPARPIIHVHADPDELGRVHRPDLAICATAPAVLHLLSQRAPAGPAPWSDWTRAAHADHLEWRRPVARAAGPHVDLAQVVAWLSDNLPKDAIVTNGAGNYAAFLHRHFRARVWPGMLAPISGSMGYGLPAAIAAQLACPDRLVVTMAGDGCFQMTLNELSTARQYNLPIIVIICNNGQYGTIRTHQERSYPGRVSGTGLFNPDYAALARAYGAFGAVVGTNADFPAAFAAARASGLPSLLELRQNPDHLTPAQDLAQIRAQATPR